MIASDLKAFDALERKFVRIIRYKGKGKIDGLGEKVFPRGYAVGFLREFLSDLLQKKTEYEHVICKLAMRMLILNRLVMLT